MDSDVILQVLLRLLPSILVFVLAFVAGADPKTRERWTNLLYQAGSLRPEQRNDPNVQRGVRLPFFIVSVLFLIWPVLYYRYATRSFDITSESDIMKPHTPHLEAASAKATAAAPAATTTTGPALPPGQAIASGPGGTSATTAPAAPGATSAPGAPAPTGGAPGGPHL